jgi:ferredoxin
MKTVRQPYLDPRQCVGCGACEFACPVGGQPAIYVTSAGESRSAANQLLLQLTVAAPPDLLPERAAGWMRTGAVRMFAAPDLWKYVDGDAERYLRAGVRRTLTAGYRWKSIEATADAHEMVSPEAARSLFASEPATGSRPVPVGESARLYGQSLTFHRGRYFARLTAYQDSPAAGDALVRLAQAIDARIT